jgi:phage shock protein A
MTDADLEALQRQNVYLKQRCAQLEGDVMDLGAQVTRLAEQLERVTAKKEAYRAGPKPLSSGQ